MAWTRRQIVTAVSAVYLIIPLALAAYALHTVRVHSLPIPTALSALTLALPFIAGLSVESSLALSRRADNKSPTQPSLPLPLLVVFETVLVSLAGTYLGPLNGRRCGLEGRWQALYSAKNAAAIRAVQDAFECCGFNSVMNRAWPFGSNDRACTERFGRTSRCLEAWGSEERRVAGIMVGAVVLVVVWEALIVLWPSGRLASWIDMMGGSRADGGRSGRRRLGYHAIEDSQRYLDEPAPTGSDAVQGDSDPEQRIANVTAPARQNEEHDRWAA